MAWRIFCLLMFVEACLGAPADNPVRVDLPVFDQPRAASEISLANPLLIENHPSPIRDTDKSIIAHLFSQNNNLEDTPSPVGAVNYGGGPFSAPSIKLDGALLETEGLGSKTLSVKENVQGVVAGLFQPKPIVDTITEEEKYGNNGDKFYSAGRAIVGGATGVSNFVNSILEVPASIFRKITRTATEKLNNFGGKLVGL